MIEWGRHATTCEPPSDDWEIPGEWFYVWRRASDGRVAAGIAFLVDEHRQDRNLRALTWRGARRGIREFFRREGVQHG